MGRPSGKDPGLLERVPVGPLLEHLDEWKHDHPTWTWVDLARAAGIEHKLAKRLMLGTAVVVEIGHADRVLMATNGVLANVYPLDMT